MSKTSLASGCQSLARPTLINQARDAVAQASTSRRAALQIVSPRSRTLTNGLGVCNLHVSLDASHSRITTHQPFCLLVQLEEAV